MSPVGPHVPLDVLSALVDGECTADERRESFEHLADCAECRHVVREYTQTRAIVAGLPRLPAPEGLVASVLDPPRTIRTRLGDASHSAGYAFRGPRKYVAAAAAAVVMAVSLGGLASPVGREAPPVDVFVARHATVSAQNNVTGQVIFAVTGR